MEPEILAERYHALTPAQQKVAGARYLELAAQDHHHRDAAWQEAIEAAELVQRL
jgi:hypothetical protein